MLITDISFQELNAVTSLLGKPLMEEEGVSHLLLPALWKDVWSALKPQMSSVYPATPLVGMF